MSSLLPSNHVPQPPDFQQFAIESGLLQRLAAEARRLDSQRFGKLGDDQLRCSIVELSDEGHLTINLSGSGADRSTVTRSFELTLQNGRIRGTPLTAQQLAGLAYAASHVIENNPNSFGHIRPHVVVANQSLSYSILEQLRDFPGRIDIRGALVNCGASYCIDEMISNCDTGTVRIVGLRREHGGYGLPRSDRDIDCYAVQVRSWDHRDWTELHLNSSFILPLRERLISLLSDGIAQRGCAEMVQYLESLQFLENVLTPQFLAGAPLAKTSEFLGRFQGLIEQDSCLADVEQAWQREGAFWCFGFYPDVAKDLLRFLSAYRYKKDGHSVSLIGVAVSEDPGEHICPADSPELINHYVCLVDGIQMPHTFVFKEHANAENLPADAKWIFESLVLKLNDDGIEALREYLGAKS